MLDLGRAAASEPDGDDLLGFVERLAEQADPASLATIRDRIEAAAPPAGLRLLAEALADAAADPDPAETGVPQQRAVPSPVPEAVAGALREGAFVVLEGADTAEVAAVAEGLAAEGLRVVVTAADAARLDELAAPALLPSPLTAAEQRELRLLLATATPARRARAGQDIPPPLALPPSTEVRALCERAAGTPAPDAALLDVVLARLDEGRLASLAAVAAEVREALAALSRPWQWRLLDGLVLLLKRAAVDSLLADSAQALAVADRSRDLPSVTVGGPLPGWAEDALEEYLAYLDGGGRSRRRFRSAVQRDVEPVLEVLRVGGEVPRDSTAVLAALRHLELARRLTSVDRGCRILGIPTPDDVGDLRALVGGLTEIDAAATAVAQLRHDVLFLHAGSPISVPDLRTAREIADTVAVVAAKGTAAEAVRRLDEITAGLVSDGPVDAYAPEHEAVVAALRSRDGEAYAAAVGGLVAARREQEDQLRCDELLLRLAAGDPAQAEAWEAGEPGSVRVAALDTVLDPLPAADLVDVVVLLGAEELGVERLLVAAAAPRLVAVSGRGARPATGVATLLGVLEQAAAPVIRSGRAVPRTPARVVALPAARRPEVVSRQQAGA
ncbi:hypothetical protein GCM10009836_70700 [Pseudonocardia ailaonensis]|uniref:Uncharacterized protein n=1 Tax=Pseudonocardia ailaonensis TaxID=367279 RepID=A0ABN2NP94_9PSEU